ncbi:hypothetical protein G7Z17_g12999 [Cylindrodendrum hubeiense]|uniref:Uncharacterized protein n=1 Tax=Cylindrodendrum hubeiense TaxID=595255 RepID=A0A9P5GX85_9HYPO|nr:hypothetical protein G7Z17_g12999 [Cylindrodendrum hubeiense]
MPLTRTHVKPTTAPRHSIFSRRRAAPRRQQVVTTTTTTTTKKPRHGLFGGNRRTVQTVHHQHRKPTMKDKVSGALLKLKGSLTHRPAVKAAGTRRMHGTDGRGSRRRL